jgi:Tfp pilus assembly protein PilN
VIKINLAKSMSVGAAPIAGFDLGASTSEMGPKTLVNIGLLLIFAVAAHLVLISNRNGADEKLRLEQSKLAQIKTEILALGGQTGEVKLAIEEMDRLDSGLKLMKSIGDDRLLSIKAMDALQTLVPARTWLQSLKFQSRKLTLEGFASSGDGLPLLMKALDESIFFSDIKVLSQAADQAAGGNSRFEIGCTVGENP